MLPDADALTDIARNVWESTLGFAILETATNRAAFPAPHLWWAVDISGHWHGTVLLCVPEGTARHAAAVTFDRAPEQVTSTDTADIVAELTNMIGGNIKGQLGGTNKLSLPRVASAEEIARAEVAPKLWFNCPGGEFAMTVAAGSAR